MNRQKKDKTWAGDPHIVRTPPEGSIHIILIPPEGSIRIIPVPEHMAREARGWFDKETENLPAVIESRLPKTLVSERGSLTVVYSKEMAFLSGEIPDPNLIITSGILDEWENKEDAWHTQILGFIKFMRKEERVLTFDAIRAYHIKLKNSDIMPDSMEHFANAVKHRLRAMFPKEDVKSQGYITAFYLDLKKDPLAAFPPRYRGPTRRDDYITEEDYHKLIHRDLVNQYPWNHEFKPFITRYQLVMKVLGESGGRISEAMGQIKKVNGVPRIVRATKLKDCYLSRDKKSVFVPIIGMKSQKAGELEFKPEVLEAIKAEFGRKTYLFETKAGKSLRSDVFRKSLARIGRMVLPDLKSLHPHMFRGLRARQILAKGGSLTEAAQVLRHSSTDITYKFYINKEQARASARWGEKD